jgi:hypothetical protein
MSLIWPANPTAVVAKEPRLHALVIGVACYPHLGGGDGTPANDPLGLSQVTTPAYTARAIVDWLTSRYKYAACPLGSIELLLSQEGNVPDEVGAMPNGETATMNAFEQAFGRWRHRCSSNKENIAFFYFCGHGLAKVDQYLLPEDFGDPAIADQWRNCINFDAMRAGMRSCKAQTQLFFVDACRETPFGLLSQINVSGQSLNSASFSDSVRCSAAYYATTDGRQAFGPPGGATYFSHALIDCLDGLAATNSQGKWQVNTYSLSAALGQVMHHLAEHEGLALDCNPNVSGFAVIHEPGQASVLTSIECSSDEATAAAEIELRRAGAMYRATVGDPKPLQCKVPPGDWEVQVRFPGGQFRSPPPLACVLMPPVFEGVDVP